MAIFSNICQKKLKLVGDKWLSNSVLAQKNEHIYCFTASWRLYLSRKSILFPENMSWFMRKFANHKIYTILFFGLICNSFYGWNKILKLAYITSVMIIEVYPMLKSTQNILCHAQLILKQKISRKQRRFLTKNLNIGNMWFHDSILCIHIYNRLNYNIWKFEPPATTRNVLGRAFFDPPSYI